MKFSLLYCEEETTALCRVFYDLSLDRAVRALIPDTRRADAFLSVLEKPLTKKENITYRQEIYRDLSAMPHLVEELHTLFSRYDRIKSDWQEMKLGASPAVSEDLPPETLLEYTFSSLKVTAIFPYTIASYFTSVGETLERYPITARGLIAMRDWCNSMVNNKALAELLSIAHRFRYQSPESFDFTVALSLDRAMQLVGADLLDIEEHKEKGGLAKLFSKKKDEGGRVPITSQLSEVGEDPEGDAALCLNEALIRLDAALTQVTGEVYESFFGLSSELLFYQAAISYAEAAKEAGVPTVLPTVLDKEADCFHARGLREILLLSLGEGGKTVPNDATIPNERVGMLIKGLTDSGKTVYLRAIGVAQIFAQAGLPVLAESAEMSIRLGFFSHFSSAEEAFSVGDNAGRFEQEAKEISRILDALPPYSLFFLNETFQTTSYSEGTAAIHDILSFLPYLKTKYIFVTHLTGLFPLMKEEPVVLAHTSDKAEERYRIFAENVEE